MNAKYKKRLEKMNAAINSLEPSMKREGKKKQRSRSVKLDRFQHNLTSAQSGQARQSWNYYPDEKQAYIS